MIPGRVGDPVEKITPGDEYRYVISVPKSRTWDSRTHRDRELLRALEPLGDAVSVVEIIDWDETEELPEIDIGTQAVTFVRNIFEMRLRIVKRRP